MSKKNFNAIVDKKIELGKALSKLRIEHKYSLRKLANDIGLPPSNLSYIENGMNVPTSEVYIKLIDKLMPPNEQRKKMDKLFSEIRNLPPPDVCDVIINNYDITDKLRLLKDTHLSDQQLDSIEKLFLTFKC